MPILPDRLTLQTLLPACFAAVILGVGAATVVIAQQDNNNPMPQLLRQLGACEQELGSLRGLQAAAAQGTVQSVAAIRAAIEKVNPDLTFENASSLKLVSKPAAPVKKEP